MLKKLEVLKEGYDNDSKERVFLAQNVEVRTAEDDWERGELGKGPEFSPFIEDFKFSKPEEFVEKLKSAASSTITSDCIWVDSESDCGRVVVTYNADKDGNDLTEEEKELWKKGEFKVYSYFLEFEISMIQENTADILINEFGWDY